MLQGLHIAEGKTLHIRGYGSTKLIDCFSCPVKTPQVSVCLFSKRKYAGTYLVLHPERFVLVALTQNGLVYTYKFIYQ